MFGHQCISESIHGTLGAASAGTLGDRVAGEAGLEVSSPALSMTSTRMSSEGLTGGSLAPPGGGGRRMLDAAGEEICLVASFELPKSLLENQTVSTDGVSAQVVSWDVNPFEFDAESSVLQSPVASLTLSIPVRGPTTWTILQQNGPNHLGLCYNMLPCHQIAAITSIVCP